MLARNLRSFSLQVLRSQALFLAMIWPIVVALSLLQWPVGLLVLLGVIAFFNVNCIGFQYLWRRALLRRLPRKLHIVGDEIEITFAGRPPFRIRANKCHLIRNWSYFDPLRLADSPSFGDMLVVPGALAKVEYVFIEGEAVTAEQLVAAGGIRRRRLDFYLAAGAVVGAVVWVPVLWMILSG